LPDRERGSVSAELALLTPLLLLFLLLMVGLGQLVSARLDVESAAAAAARAASQSADPGSATAAAEQSATSSIGSGACAHLAVSVDTTHFVPGGSVTVTIRCSVPLADVAGLHLPGSETLTSSFAEPLDRYGTVQG
jgi:Flp pilus assembly protein TadG